MPSSKFRMNQSKMLQTPKQYYSIKVIIFKSHISLIIFATYKRKSDALEVHKIVSNH